KARQHGTQATRRHRDPLGQGHRAAPALPRPRKHSSATTSTQPASASTTPAIHSVGTGPQNRLSSGSPRLSPSMNQWPGGILSGVGKLQSAAPAGQGLMKLSG